ncbi:hypothetical protein F511_16895 [Dorcoceras hygrometricum]|uniref:Uncharacterized protein n=1 Tax=Dorcoceras hygrometricum TaxID=472368 RepID=A0A2Z7CV46_9LAMI|nr:hypothetical protein F511_16895 [Dorcoceras hygrometricum]
MIPLDFSGTTHQSASHNVAPNQVINQSVKGSIYNSKHGRTHGRRNQLSPGSKFTAAGLLELKSVQGINYKDRAQFNKKCSPKSLNPEEKHTAQISPNASNNNSFTLPLQR